MAQPPHTSHRKSSVSWASFLFMGTLFAVLFTAGLETLGEEAPFLFKVIMPLMFGIIPTIVLSTFLSLIFGFPIAFGKHRNAEKPTRRTTFIGLSMAIVFATVWYNVRTDPPLFQIMFPALFSIALGFFMFVLTSSFSPKSRAAFKPIRQHDWIALAQEFDLTYTPPPTQRDIATLTGTVDGIHIQVSSETTERTDRESKRTTYSTLFSIRAFFTSPLPAELTIHTENVLSDMGKLFKQVHDLDTGDAAFDSTFVIRTDHPEKTLQLLQPEVRSSLLTCVQQDMNPRINDEGLHNSRSFTFQSIDQARELLQLSVHTVRSLQEAAAQTTMQQT